MISAHYTPRAPLSEFVSLFWYWDGYVQPHARERMLPDGSMTIVFNLGEDRIRLYEPDATSSLNNIRGHAICGARSQPMVADTANMVTTLGIQFRPGGAFPFLRMPASELNEQCVSLDDIFGSDVRTVRDRLLELATPEEKFAAAEQWLLSSLQKPLERHPAVGYAIEQFLRAPEMLRVSPVLDRIGFSQRHFNQLFSAEVGLTPKRFLRVRRFQHAIASIALRTSVDWAELALSCGYYDQAHFAHDFRNFCGFSPAAYLLHRTPHLNHLPVVD
jgi:AraC-like DNA-binding protein